VALQKLLAQKAVDGLTTHKVASLEQDTCLLHGRGHIASIGCAQAQRLFDEQVLTGCRTGQNEFLVPVGLGADDGGRNGGVFPNSLDSGHSRRVKVLAIFLGSRYIMIPDSLNGNI
jgi:hypothetical protein